MKTSTTTGFVILAALALNTGDVRAGTAAFDASMQPLIAEYGKIHRALASDSTKGIARAAKTIARLSKKLAVDSVTGMHAKHYKDMPANIAKAASRLANAKGIKANRAAFKELSRPLAMWVTMSKPVGISLVFCSMAKASWLQHDPKRVKNPYYGKKMLKCGQFIGGASKGHASGKMSGKMSGHKMHKH